MTDKQEKKPDPKEEIRKTLDGILAAVQKKKDAAKVAGKSSKPWGWVVGLILAVLVFIALAFAAWSAWKKGREIAKLKHKIDVDEEKKIQAETELKIALDEDLRKELEKEAIALKVTIDSDKKKIHRLEKERKAAHEKIDAVTSWEDVDAL
jgi:hypothetical protein